MGRPSTPLLSPRIIGEAGRDLARAGEPFGVNAIARKLGVRPSSLYHHVQGMEEIVELIRGCMIEDYTVPHDGLAWDTYLVASMRAQRRMYADHLELVPLLVGTTITHPAVLAAYSQTAGVLLDAGFPATEVLSLVAVIDAFAIGFGLDLASPHDVWESVDADSTLGALLTEATHGEERADQAFEIGLDLLIDGLRRRLLATD